MLLQVMATPIKYALCFLVLANLNGKLMLKMQRVKSQLLRNPGLLTHPPDNSHNKIRLLVLRSIDHCNFNIQDLPPSNIIYLFYYNNKIKSSLVHNLQKDNILDGADVRTLLIKFHQFIFLWTLIFLFQSAKKLHWLEL